MAACREHGFAHALDDSHGATGGLARHGNNQRFDLEIGFAAVSAADKGHDDFHFCVRQVEHMRDLRAN